MDRARRQYRTTENVYDRVPAENYNWQAREAAARDPRQVSSIHMIEAHPQYRSVSNSYYTPQAPPAIPSLFNLIPHLHLPPLLPPLLPLPGLYPPPAPAAPPPPPEPQQDYPQVVQTNYPHPSPSCGQNILVGCQPSVQQVPCTYGQNYQPQQQAPPPDVIPIQSYPPQNQAYSGVQSIHTTADESELKPKITPELNKPRNNESEDEEKNERENDAATAVNKETEMNKNVEQRDEVRPSPMNAKKIQAEFMQDKEEERKRKFKDMMDEKMRNSYRSDETNKPIESKQTNAEPVIPATTQTGRPVRSQYRYNVW